MALDAEWTAPKEWTAEEADSDDMNIHISQNLLYLYTYLNMDRLFNDFSYPNPGTDWTPAIAGAELTANKAAKVIELRLFGLRLGERIISYKLVGDATEADALTLDCKLVRIDKTDPLTETDVPGGSIVQVNSGGNFDVEAILTESEIVATDSQYVLLITGTTGAGDSIIVMGAEVKIETPS